jgi:precorrin-6B methylase 2
MSWTDAVSIPGWMHRRALHWLFLKSEEMETIVEIGCWMGRSTYALCSGCKGKVYAVDHFLGGVEPTLRYLIDTKRQNPYDEFIKNMKGFDNLEVLRMLSEEASLSSLIPSFVDMVFIDGAHDYDSVKRDIELWYPRTKKLICGHDLCRDSVQKAVREYFGDRMAQVSGDIWSVEVKEGEKR